jgi:hypothetical protein
VAAVAVLVGVGWRLRFRPSPETLAWARARPGERHVPRSQANIDHLVIGTPGVFVVDAKHYRCPLHLAHDGGLWHGRYPWPPR